MKVILECANREEGAIALHGADYLAVVEEFGRYLSKEAGNDRASVVRETWERICKINGIQPYIPS